MAAIATSSKPLALNRIAINSKENPSARSTRRIKKRPARGQAAFFVLLNEPSDAHMQDRYFHHAILYSEHREKCDEREDWGERE